METVNRHLFLMINAGGGITGPRLAISTLVADFAVLLVPLTLVLLWFRDRSFPSDHMTVFCAAGLALAIDRATRRAGTLLLLTALPVAWSRIYLGVHFPFDMIGGIGTAAISVAAVRIASRPLENLACRPLLRLYGTMGHPRRYGGK